MSDPMTMMIGEHASLSAPPGSRSWSTAVKWEIQKHIHDYMFAVQCLEEYFEMFAEHKGWSQLNGYTTEPFQSLEEFCKTRQPMGLGYSPNTINAIIAERRCHKESEITSDPPTARPTRRRRK